MKSFLGLCLFLFSFLTQGQTLALDPSFGTGGTQLTNSLILPVSGKFENNQYYLLGNDTRFMRYNFDGSVDYSFGNYGFFSFGITNQYPKLKDFKVHNGYIYAFGKCVTPGQFSNDGIVIRLTANGQLDATFGNNGLVRLDLGSEEIFNDILVNNDGSFYALGVKQTNDGNYQYDARILLCKYLNNGSLDTSFNATGYIIYPDTLQASGISIFPYENGILLANWGLSTTVSTGDIYLKKIDSNGNLMTDFGNGGNLRMQAYFGSGAIRHCKAIKLNGTKIYCDHTWSVTASVQGRRMICYDISNPTAPAVDFPFNAYQGAYFEPLSSGKILTASGIFGDCGISGSCNNTKFNLKQYGANGQLDTSFDIDGQFDYDFNSGLIVEGATYFYRHADGRIFITGGHNGGSYLSMLRVGDVNLATPDINSRNNFSVFPNPVSQTLYLNNKVNALLENAIVHDISGKKIELSINNNSIDVSGLSNGIYFLLFEAAGKQHCLKFIKS